jgi:hypothetical protein
VNITDDEIPHLRSEPIDNLIHDLFDGAFAGIKSEMRLAVRHEPLIIEGFHFNAIGRERAAARLSIP